MVRTLPNIPKIKAHWRSRSSEIPDYLEVPMSDGTVVRYIPQGEHPAFTKAMTLIRNMTDPRTGYQRKEHSESLNIRPAAKPWATK